MLTQRGTSFSQLCCEIFGREKEEEGDSMISFSKCPDINALISDLNMNKDHV